MKRIIFALLVSILLFSCDSEATREPRHVNIVAIGFSYEGVGNENVSELPVGPHEDAEAMLAHLSFLSEKAGYEVESYHITDRNGSIINNDTGETMTAADLKSLLSSFSADPWDLNIFYYSGHGAYTEDGGSLIILPEIKITGMKLSDVAALLGKSGGKSIMIIDACQSGGSSPNDVGSGEAYVTDEDGVEHFVSISPSLAIGDAFRASFSVSRDYGDVYVLSACTPRQYSYAGTEENPNSMFTSAMLGYLGYDASSGTSQLPKGKTVTFSSLYQNVLNRIMQDTIELNIGVEEPIGDVQTPQPTRIPTDLVLFRF